MVTIAIVQGRLSPQVGGRYQHFPIHAWREEFRTAAELGFDGIEWIVSDLSNPLFDPIGLLEADRLRQSCGLRISSLSLDVLMYHPVHTLSSEDLQWLFDRICAAVQFLGVKRVSIPIEENSGIRSNADSKAVIPILQYIIDRYAEQIPLLCLETDLSPSNARCLLESPGLERLGLLVDLGNIAANGFSLQDFLHGMSSRIYGVHVKDRPGLFGSSCRLGAGDAEIQSALKQCPGVPNLADVTLQCMRTPDNFLEDARSALSFVRRILRELEVQ